MYTMKEACVKTGLSYETLKFYCNQGLVPNVKRDSQNRRIFNDRDIDWKQGFYDDVLSGKTKYFINLIASDE